jgi:hypothetical protein
MRGLTIRTIVLGCMVVLLAACSPPPGKLPEHLEKYKALCAETLRQTKVLEGSGGQIVNLEGITPEMFSPGFIPSPSGFPLDKCRVYTFSTHMYWDGKVLRPYDDDARRMVLKEPSLEKSWAMLSSDLGGLVRKKEDRICLEKLHACNKGLNYETPPNDRIVRLKNYPLDVWLPNAKEGLRSNEGLIYLVVRDWSKGTKYEKPLVMECGKLESFDLATREGIENIDYGNKPMGCQFYEFPFNEGALRLSVSSHIFKDPIPPLRALQAHLNRIVTRKE